MSQVLKSVNWVSEDRKPEIVIVANSTVPDHSATSWELTREPGSYINKRISTSLAPSDLLYSILSAFSMNFEVLFNNTIIARSDSVNLTHSALDEILNVCYHIKHSSAFDVLLDVPQPEPQDTVQWWYNTPSGVNKSEMPLKGHTPKQEFYPWLDQPLEEFAYDFATSSANVLLLIGPPGTGKTSFIRALIRNMGYETWITYDEAVQQSEGFYIAFASIGDSDYYKPMAGSVLERLKQRAINEMNQRNKVQMDKMKPEIRYVQFADEDLSTGRCLVMEDCDAMLSKREDGNKIMNRLLNLSDGLITLPARKIIFSTNLPSIQSVDDAILRPGRCFGAIKFRELAPNEAVAAAASIGRNIPTPVKNITLSQALNGTQKHGPQVRRIGF